MDKECGKVDVEEEGVIESASIHLALKKTINTESMNAVAVDCIDPIYRNSKRTPSILLTRLKDEGIPSAYEAYLNALLTMIILTFLSNKPAFMGNA